MYDLAVFGGLVGMVVSIVALIVIFLIKKDISSTLYGEASLFDQNFNIKKQAIEKAEKLLDDLCATRSVGQNSEFIRRAKESYNELLCVVTDQAVAENFKNYALTHKYLSEEELQEFKLQCRKDIGFKVKKPKRNNNEKQKYNQLLSNAKKEQEPKE